MTTRFALSLALLALSTAHAQMDRPDLPPEPPAAAPAAPRAAPAPACARPLATVMITDDPYRTEAEAAEQWRGLRMPAWQAIANDLARASGCYRLFDPDPLLLALPGATLPDAILRVRPVRLALHEKTFGEKINEGINSYIESYTAWLGAKTPEGPPLLRELGVSLAVLCPRERRVVRDFAATDRELPAPAVDGERRHTGAAQNRQRAERAIAAALAEVTRGFARDARWCAPAPPPPAAPPGAPGSATSPPGGDAR